MEAERKLKRKRNIQLKEMKSEENMKKIMQ